LRVRRGGCCDSAHLRHHREQNVLVDLGAAQLTQPSTAACCSHTLIGGRDRVR
jgi:hypothetical protein